MIATEATHSGPLLRFRTAVFRFVRRQRFNFAIHRTFKLGFGLARGINRILIRHISFVRVTQIR